VKLTISSPSYVRGIPLDLTESQMQRDFLEMLPEHLTTISVSGTPYTITVCSAEIVAGGVDDDGVPITPRIS